MATDERIKHGIVARDGFGETVVDCALCGERFECNGLPAHDCKPDGLVGMRLKRADLVKEAWVAELRKKQLTLF